MIQDYILLENITFDSSQKRAFRNILNFSYIISMNADEIQVLSQSIAFHPLVAIGGLMVLISIARKMDLTYKERTLKMGTQSK